MKFKLDENLSPSLAKLFAAAGHDAHSIVEQDLLPYEPLVGTLWIIEEGRVRIRE